MSKWEIKQHPTTNQVFEVLSNAGNVTPSLTTNPEKIRFDGSGGGSGNVDDVRINNTSIVTDKIANIQTDNTPTEDSAKLVESGGVYAALEEKVDKETGKGLSTLSSYSVNGNTLTLNDISGTSVNFVDHNDNDNQKIKLASVSFDNNTEITLAASGAISLTGTSDTITINAPVVTDTNQTIKVNSTTFSANAVVELAAGDNVTLATSTNKIIINSASDTNQKITADSTTFGDNATIEIAAGDNINIIASSDKITISGTSDTHYTETFTIKSGSTTAASFDQEHSATLNIIGDGATTVSASSGEITISSTDTTYSAGDHIQINGTTISANYSTATSSTDGLMSSVDKTKLDGLIVNDATITIIQGGTTAGTFTTNQGTSATINLSNDNDNQTIKVGSTTFNVNAEVTLAAGSNITSISADTSTNTITINAKDTTYSNATTTTAGLMSASDKVKLNGIASGAEVNVQANWTEADSSSDAFIKNKPTIPTVNDATITFTQNGVSKGSFTTNQSTSATIALVDTTYENATTSVSGLMSASDKSKLDGIPADAQKNVQSDWNVTSTSSDAYIANKPTIPTVNNSTITIIQGSTSSSFTTNQATSATITLSDNNDNQTIKVGSMIFGANDAVTLANGGNITLSASGTTITISASDQYTGTVTSVSAADGLVVTGSATTTPTIGVSTDYKLPTATEWSNKQDKLASQSAYTNKGTSTKVPQITTNTLGQVTGITEVDINFPGGNNQTITADSTSFGPSAAVNLKPSGTVSITASSVDNEITISASDQYTGTVTSVSTGTGLSITGTSTVNPTVNVDSGYKLPTTTEWDSKADTSTLSNYLPLAGGIMSGSINSENIIPNITNTKDLGSNTKVFANIYANKYNLKNNINAYSDTPTSTSDNFIVYSDKNNSELTSLFTTIGSSWNALNLRLKNKSGTQQVIEMMHSASSNSWYFDSVTDKGFNLGQKTRRWNEIWGKHLVSRDGVPNFSAYIEGDNYTTTPSTTKSAQYIARDDNGQYLGGMRVYHNTDGSIETQLMCRSQNTNIQNYVMFWAGKNATADTNTGKFYLLPNTSNNIGLGSSSHKWKDYYGAGNIYLGETNANDNIIAFQTNGTTRAKITGLSNSNILHQAPAHKFSTLSYTNILTLDPTNQVVKPDTDEGYSLGICDASSTNKFNNIVSKTNLSTYYSNTRTARPTSADFEHYSDSAVQSKGKPHLLFDVATGSMTTNKPGSDGYLLTMMWDNTGMYDAQIFFPNSSSGNKGRPQIRNNIGGTSGTPNWTSWENIPLFRDFGFCNTAAATATKQVYMTDYTLRNGNWVYIYFANTNSAANPKLEIFNGTTSTGAKSIYYDNSTGTAQSALTAGWHLFYYNGSAYYTGWMIPCQSSLSNNTINVRSNTATKAATAITAKHLIFANASGEYANVAAGSAINILMPIQYAGSDIAAAATGTNNYIECNLTATDIFGSGVTLTTYAPVFLVGTLSGTTFTLDSTTWYTQTIPTSVDSKQYMLLGYAYSTTTMRLLENHPIYRYYESSFKKDTFIPWIASKNQSAATASGTYSTAIGSGSTVSSSNSVAIGDSATASGAGAIVIGKSASATKTSTVALGYNANATGNYSTVIGEAAKDNGKTSSVIIGQGAYTYTGYSTVIGRGANSGGSGATGTYNVVIGYNAIGFNAGSGIAIGKGAHAGYGTYSISIGTDVVGVEAANSRSVRIGASYSSAGQALLLGDGLTNFTFMNQAGNSWQTASDIRDKTDIEEIEHALDFINKLKPITYVMNNRQEYLLRDEENKPILDKDGKQQYDIEEHKKGSKKKHRRIVGLSAQATYQAMLDSYNNNDNYADIVDNNKYDNPDDEYIEQYSMSYERLVPFLIKAMQEQQDQIKELQDEIKQLKNN